MIKNINDPATGWSMIGTSIVLLGLMVLPSCMALPWGEAEDERDRVMKSTARTDASASDVPIRQDGTLTSMPVGPDGDLEFTISTAILIALENNDAFQIDRMRPRIVETYERESRSRFDPVVGGNASMSSTRSDLELHSANDANATREDWGVGGITVREFLPTGTTIEAGAHRSGTALEDLAEDMKRHQTSFDIRITQALLRGFGPGVNLARLRQARLDSRISEHELAAAAELLVAQVERTYWNYLLASKSIEIYEQSLKVAERQLKEAQDSVRLGTMAETELAATEADVALRKEDLIDSRGRLATVRLHLVRLINPGGESPWTRTITIAEDQDLTNIEELDDVEAHVKLALQSRHDLAQSRLLIKRGGLEVIRTRNGLLPKLDLFAQLGGTEYSQSFSKNPDMDGNDRNVTVGVVLEYAVGQRAERAAHQRSLLSLRQSESALANLKQLVQVDVRSACIEVHRSAEKIAATAATRKHRDAALSSERAKLRAGRSTTLLVSQAWRDAIASRIAELDARIQYRIALVELYRLEGSLLNRRGIQLDAQ